MKLKRKHREVFNDDEYERQALEAYAPHANQLTPDQFGDFAESIKAFLSEYADTCPAVYGGDRPVYMYKPTPPAGFETVSVLFTVEKDDNGEWVLLASFRAS